jgi:hypothetical protein
MRRQLPVNFLRLLLFFTLFLGASVPGWAQAARGYPDELLTVEFPRNSLHALDYPITKNRSEELKQVRNFQQSVCWFWQRPESKGLG